MNGTTQHDDAYPPGMNILKDGTMEFDLVPTKEFDFNEKLRVVFHWPLYLWGDDDAPTHVDCDYCGIEIWTDHIIFRPEQWVPGMASVNGHINLDTLYKAVTGHMPDCEHAPAEGTLEKESESQ